MTESLLVPNVVVAARDTDLNAAMAAPGGVHSQRTHTDNCNTVVASVANGSPVAQEPWEGTGPSLEVPKELAEGFDVSVKLHMKEEGRKGFRARSPDIENPYYIM